MDISFEKGDHIADKSMIIKGIFGAGTVSSSSSEGYWVNGVSGGSTVIKRENAISAQEALEVLKKSN